MEDSAVDGDSGSVSWHEAYEQLTRSTVSELPSPSCSLDAPKPCHDVSIEPTFVMSVDSNRSPHEKPGQSDHPPPEPKDIEMGGTSHAGIALPFEHHSRDALPEAIIKAYPGGNPSAKSRSAEQQAEFEAKKEEILKQMNPQEMQQRYKQLAREIAERLEEREKKIEEWNAEKEKMESSQKTEEKVLKKMLGAMQED